MTFHIIFETIINNENLKTVINFFLHYLLNILLLKYVTLIYTFSYYFLR